MIFKNNIQKIVKNKKLYYASILNGLLEYETIKYFSENGFTYITLPELNEAYIHKKLVFEFSNDNIEFELNNSQAMRMTVISTIYDKVFSINRCFRKETNKEKTHLIEFKMLEIELSINKEKDIFALIDNYLHYIVTWFNNYIHNNHLEKFFSPKIINFPIDCKDYETIFNTYLEQGKTLDFDRYNFSDLDITKDIKEPLYITYYPHEGNWRAKWKDKKYSYLYNLVLPYGFGELVEFSIRETSYEYYDNKFRNLGYTKYYQWYLDAIKNINSSKAGLGLGIERLCSWLMNLDEIDDQLVFPRIPNRRK